MTLLANLNDEKVSKEIGVAGRFNKRKVSQDLEAVKK